MKKRVLTDGSGRWFDEDASKAFLSASFIHVSGAEICLATGSTNVWETLYLTPYGAFVLVRISDEPYPEQADRAVDMDTNSAVQWLITNGHQEEVKKLDLLSEERQLEI